MGVMNRHGDRGADDLRLDRAHWPVPHRAVHEPRALLATIGSAIFLGDLIAPAQAIRYPVGIAALVAFQTRK